MSAPASDDDEAAQERRLVGRIAPGALFASVAGAVLAIATRNGPVTAAHVAGLAVMAAGGVAGFWCRWHGSRNEHERGYWFAIAAVVAALVGVAVLYGGSSRFPVLR